MDACGPAEPRPGRERKASRRYKESTQGQREAAVSNCTGTPMTAASDMPRVPASA